MDKKTRDLRTRLRDRYAHYREAIGAPEPSPGSGYFKWLHDQRAKESKDCVYVDGNPSEMIVADSLTGPNGTAEALASSFLQAIAHDEEITFVCGSLGIRPALSIIPAASSKARAGLEILRPNGVTFPIAFERSSGLLCYVAEVLDEWVDWLADDAEPAPMQGEPVLDMKLGKKARAVLKLLVGERAFDESKAIRLAKVAPTKLKCGQAKTASTRVKYAEEGSEELRERGLAQAVQSVGTWLTPKGKTEAERLFGK